VNSSGIFNVTYTPMGAEAGTGLVLIGGMVVHAFSYAIA
jgi:hypothetical protein